MGPPPGLSACLDFRCPLSSIHSRYVGVNIWGEGLHRAILLLYPSPLLTHLHPVLFPINEMGFSQSDRKPLGQGSKKVAQDQLPYAVLAWPTQARVMHSCLSGQWPCRPPHGCLPSLTRALPPTRWTQREISKPTLSIDVL